MTPYLLYGFDRFGQGFSTQVPNSFHAVETREYLLSVGCVVRVRRIEQ